MLNPSTADEQANDPTIARCETRGRDWGFGGIEIVNLFAYRATDPKDLKKAKYPEGPENTTHLTKALDDAGLILAAWGVHGAHRGQDQKVLADLTNYDLHVLGLTKAGLPRHPLYVGYNVKPQPWHLKRS